MSYVNKCKYNAFEDTLRRRKNKGCIHPMRKNLDDFLDKMFGIFSDKRACAATPLHEERCPYFENRFVRPVGRPSRPPQDKKGE